MICEHCGTEHSCPTCNANEVLRLGKKMDEIKAQSRRIIFIYMPITITVTFSLILRFLIYPEAIFKIPDIGGTTILKRPSPASIENIKPYTQEQILPNGAIAEYFSIEDPNREILLSVDVTCIDRIDSPLTMLLLTEDNFQNYTKGNKYEEIHKSEEVLNFVYDGALQSGLYYIVLINQSSQDVSVEIRTSLAPGSIRQSTF